MDHPALRFCLDEIFLSRRFDDLEELLDDASETAGIEGDPGWRLERLEGSAARPLYRAAVDAEAGVFRDDTICIADERTVARMARSMFDELFDVTGKKVDVRRAITSLKAELAPLLAALQRASE
jgi:hypothetical protein